MHKAILVPIVSSILIPFISKDTNIENGSDLPQGSSLHIQSDIYGPFYIGESNSNIKINYSVITYSSKVYEKLSCYSMTGTLLTYVSSASHPYISGNKHDVDFVLKNNLYLSSNGMKCVFEIIDSESNNKISSSDFTLYPSSNNYLDFYNYMNQAYVSKPIGFVGEGAGFNSLFESLDFINTKTYIDVDYYYRLLINNNYFSFNTPFAFTYSDCELTFNDDDYLFPYYRHDLDSNIHIPLKLIYEDNKIHFEYKKGFYLNTKTLQISDQYVSDFIPTNYFYLPINSKKLFNGKNLTIKVNGLGGDNVSFDIPLTYDSSHSLVGLCGESEYCIIGGVRK